MTKTPWGDTDELRRRQLRPGSRLGPEEVARSQRERLFAAMVAAVADRGYEATKVADLVELSGVSRSAFYVHFSDKQACFLAALEASLQGAMDLVAARYDGRGSGLQAFVEVIAAQPAAARMAFLDVYPAGSRATELMDEAVAAVEALYREAFAARDGEQMPDELVRAIVGGLRRVIQNKLLRGEEDELEALVPGLWSWSFGYRPPPKPLRRRRSRSSARAADHDPGDPAERIIRASTEAIVERGYAAARVSDIVERAGVSLSTFYAHFEGKEAAFWAALDAGQARMFAQMLPVFRRTRPQGWPHAVRAGCEAMVRFMASDPEFARLAVVESYRAGPRAMRLRNEALGALRHYLEPGYELAPELSPVAADAIPGAVSALIYNQLQGSGPTSLAEIEASTTYLVLAPFLGAEEACALARGEG